VDFEKAALWARGKISRAMVAIFPASRKNGFAPREKQRRAATRLMSRASRRSVPMRSSS
jgi:hypothetical protein